MSENTEEPQNNFTENYDTPNIVGDIDTVEEEVEYLEKKIKIPVWIWVALIIVISIVTLLVTANQSPTLTF
ncbi:MAG: hypothetical protein PHU42_03215 [Patescibacteria group bacterium]|nr:hypothetical protein [Patescibacteria group bacterium]